MKKKRKYQLHLGGKREPATIDAIRKSNNDSPFKMQPLLSHEIVTEIDFIKEICKCYTEQFFEEVKKQRKLIIGGFIHTPVKSYPIYITTYETMIFHLSKLANIIRELNKDFYGEENVCSNCGVEEDLHYPTFNETAVLSCKKIRGKGNGKI